MATTSSGIPLLMTSLTRLAVVALSNPARRAASSLAFPEKVAIWPPFSRQSGFGAVASLTASSNSPISCTFSVCCGLPRRSNALISFSTRRRIASRSLSVRLFRNSFSENSPSAIISMSMTRASISCQPRMPAPSSLQSSHSHPKWRITKSTAKAFTSHHTTPASTAAKQTMAPTV